MKTETPITDSSLIELEQFTPSGLLKCSRKLESELYLQKAISKGLKASRDAIVEERDKLLELLLLALPYVEEGEEFNKNKSLSKRIREVIQWKKRNR